MQQVIHVTIALRHGYLQLNRYRIHLTRLFGFGHGKRLGSIKESYTAKQRTQEITSGLKIPSASASAAKESRIAYLVER
jgi:hypothetical protein